MLADPRSATLGSNFAYQWLGLAKLDSLAPDPFVFGDVDRNIRADFVEEAWLLRRQHFPRGPQRARPADGRPHLS